MHWVFVQETVYMPCMRMIIFGGL